jgi:hypothetical protein
MVATPAYSLPRSPSRVLPCPVLLPKRNIAVFACTHHRFARMHVTECSGLQTLADVLEMSHLYVFGEISGCVDCARQHLE